MKAIIGGWYLLDVGIVYRKFHNLETRNIAWHIYQFDLLCSVYAGWYLLDVGIIYRKLHDPETKNIALRIY